MTSGPVPGSVAVKTGYWVSVSDQDRFSMVVYDVLCLYYLLVSVWSGLDRYWAVRKPLGAVSVSGSGPSEPLKNSTE